MAIRPFRSLTTAAFAALALAACSDRVTDPGSSLRPDEPRLTIASTSTTTFTLNPTVTNVYQSVEGHRIVIPAYSICQVGTSGYGKSFWDAPCAPQTLPVVFTLTTSQDANGRARLTVFPDVRFSPSKTVMVYLKDAGAASRVGSYIEYCFLTGCVNEGATDGTMTTYRDPAAGFVYRRLKHFSGYNVVFGRSCENPDPNTGECPTGSTSKSPLAPISPSLFAGYITTTGRNGR